MIISENTRKHIEMLEDMRLRIIEENDNNNKEDN